MAGSRRSPLPVSKRDAIGSVALALLANAAYLLADTPESRHAWHYVTSGAALAIAAVWLAVRLRNPFASVGLAWLAWEQAQVAACGVGGYGLVVPIDVSGLCAYRYGATAYLIGCACAIMAAFVVIWSRSRARSAR